MDLRFYEERIVDEGVLRGRLAVEGRSERARGSSCEVGEDNHMVECLVVRLFNKKDL